MHWNLIYSPTWLAQTWRVPAAFSTSWPVICSSALELHQPQRTVHQDICPMELDGMPEKHLGYLGVQRCM